MIWVCVTIWLCCSFVVCVGFGLGEIRPDSNTVFSILSDWVLGLLFSLVLGAACVPWLVWEFLVCRNGPRENKRRDQRGQA